MAEDEFAVQRGIQVTKKSELTPGPGSEFQTPRPPLVPSSEDVAASLQARQAKETQETNAAIEGVRKMVNSFVGEAKLPIESGDTSFLIYGGKLNTDPEGRLVYDMRLKHLKHDIDRGGDRLLRSFEDNYMKDPIGMLFRHPKQFFRFMHMSALGGTRAMRYRGNKEQILANCERLGLDDYYGRHDWGVEFKKPELLQKGYPLQDIMRSDKIDREGLKEIDRFDALEQTSAFLGDIHEKHGEVGEFNIFAVIFEGAKGDKAEKPALYLPTIVYNPEMKHGENYSKAVDLLDFLVSATSEEIGRNTNERDVVHAAKAAISGYSDAKVIKMAMSLAGRGNLSLPGDEKVAKRFSSLARTLRPLFSLHNVQRFNIKAGDSAAIRDLVIETFRERLAELEAAS